MSEQPPVNTEPTSPPEAAVVDQARTFLASPLIADQPVQAKRQFLLEKGLAENQVELLLRQVPPSLPPPTYPQPAPSSLPTLLLGIFRLFSYAMGASAAVPLFYYRFLFPRIVQTSQARLSLKVHQSQLLRKLHEGLVSLKEQQVQSFAVLPKPIPFKEAEHLSQCQSVAQLRDTLESKNSNSWRDHVPVVTFLRCAISDVSKQIGQDEVPTEAIFECLETQIGPVETTLKESLWDTLNQSPLFRSVSVENADLPNWAYEAPPPPEPTPLSHSADALLAALPKKSEGLPGSPSERLMASLSTLTGYLSTAIYAAPRSIAPGGMEDEIRKEIRALKGLSLNRKSFVTSTRSLSGSGS